MRETSLNKEAKLHRLFNQRRITFSLIERSRTFLAPGINFTRELHGLFKAQGKFGSKDRRLYRELIYTYVRYQPWLEKYYADSEVFMDKLILLAAQTPEIESLYPTLTDKTTLPSESEKRYHTLGMQDHDLLELLPEWFSEHINRPLNPVTVPPLFQRPPLWLRVQKDPKLNVLEQIQAIDPTATRHDLVPDCIQASPNISITNLPCYENGLIEIQDISSQILLELLDKQPCGNWFDACAGAGGKTLQLAKLVQPYGKVFAFDPRPSAIRELKKRVQRSGLRNVKVLDRVPIDAGYDGVLVDAPCSGSGTWRRHPFLMRQTREEDVFNHADQQLSILRSYAPLVREGGLLVYSTCSLSRKENEEVSSRFLETQPDYRHEPLGNKFGLTDVGQGITVYPDQFNGDGLYVCVFKNVG